MILNSTAGLDRKAAWRRPSRYQKLNFKASWTKRGLTEVDEICPKLLELKFVAGSANCGVLNKLKNSARNSIRVLSERSGIFFRMDMSMFCWAGPLTMPTPLFPKAVALPSSPITGGVVKHLALK